MSGKSKLFILSTIISSCVLGMAGNAAAADQRHPNLPSGGYKCGEGQSCNGSGTMGKGTMKGSNGSMKCNGSGMKQQGNDSMMQSNGSMMENNRSGMSGTMDGGNGSGMMKAPLTMDSIETMKGTIKTMKRIQYPDGSKMHMILSTNEGDMVIMMGPSSVMDQSKVKLEAGEKVQVKGYRVTANGKTMMVAVEVKKNDGNVISLPSQNTGK